MENQVKLHDEEEEFKAAITKTAAHFKIRELFVEKDYWVTYVLKCLHKSKFAEEVVFKGGTSISKAYGIAKRFSEDIDLALVDTKTETMAELTSVIMLPPLSKNPDRTERGSKNYNQTHWVYPRKINGNPEPAKENIQLELINNAKTGPNEKMKIRSLIAEFLHNEKNVELIKEYELEEFEISVLSYKRTFAEKVVALANASIKKDKNKSLKGKIRHVFDLTVLSMEKEIQDFVKSDEFLTMTTEARKSDEALSFMQDVVSTPWKDAPIFTDTDVVLKEIKSTYEYDLKPFIFKASALPKMSQVKKMLKFILEPHSNAPPKASQPKRTTANKKNSKSQKKDAPLKRRK